MKLNIIAFDGDGIGPEIVSSTLDVINLLNSKLKLEIEIQREILGFNLLKKNGVTFTDDLLLKSKEADGIILGPVDHNAYPSLSNGGINPSAKLRIELDLYSNIRPAKKYVNVKSLSKNIDKIENQISSLTSKVRSLSNNEKKSLNILCKRAALRYLVTRSYDYLNTPKNAIIKIKDPKEYIQKLNIHNKFNNFKNYYS